MAGLEQFAGVAAATDAQKAALGKFIAQQGSAGVDSWKAEQAVGQAMGADARAGVIGSNPGIGNPAAASAVGPGQLTQMLAARASQPGQLMAQQGAQAAADFGAYTGLLGQANANYGDAVKGAAPIVESQTRATVAGIQAELAAKREAMQAEADARAQAIEDAQRERDWATQDRMLMLADEARRRQWEIDDRRTAEKEEKASTLGSYDDAWKAVGVNEETARKISSSATYTQTVNDVMKNLVPGMDQRQVEGLIDSFVDNYSGTKGPEANSRMKAILYHQFANITGERASAAYNKPPEQPGDDQAGGGGGGGGGGFGGFLGNAGKFLATSVNPVGAAITTATGNNPVLNAVTGSGGGSDKAAGDGGAPYDPKNPPKGSAIRLLSTKALQAFIRDAKDGSTAEVIAYDELRSRPGYSGG